jgi:hypothetical protein
LTICLEEARRCNIIHVAACLCAFIHTRAHTHTHTQIQVAASGGYMMACVADRLCASPFAVVGSIGVITEVRKKTSI